MATTPGEKIYVLDTSSIIDENECVTELAKGGNIVVVPRKVVHELDGLRKKNRKESSLYMSASRANKLLDSLRSNGKINRDLDSMLEGRTSLDQYQQLSNGGYVFWETRYQQLEPYMDPGNNDNIILATAKYLLSRAEGRKVTLITEDVNLRLKADSEDIDLNAEALRMGKEELKEGHYKGYSRVFVDSSVIQKFMDSAEPGSRTLPLEDIVEGKIEGQNKAIEKTDKKFHWNEGIILVDRKTNSAEQVLAVVEYPNGGKKGVLRELKYSQAWNSGNKLGYHYKTILGLKPGDTLQAFAMEYLLNPNIGLVILDGKAGTGKTRLMMTASINLLLGSPTEFGKKLKKAVEKTDYSEGLLLARPEYSVTDFQLAAVPGGVEDKVTPWIQPYISALKRLTKPLGFNCHERLKASEMIKIMSTSQFRGINIENCIGLIDEVQNGNRHFAKTLMSRFGEGSKGVIAGDITQIDNRYVGPRNNALTIIREAYKGKGPEIAMITLEKNYRGRISKIAEDI